MKKFLIAILALIGAGYFTGYESRIFGTAYLHLGLQYDHRLQIAIIIMILLVGYLIYNRIKKFNRIIFILGIIFISRTSFTGGFLNNTLRVYNVLLFGADPTFTNDATSAIQNAAIACDAGGGGDVYFPNGIYKISGALQTSVHSINPNCQIYIPSRGLYSAQRNSIRFIGEGNTTFGSSYIPATVLPKQTTGVILRSTLTSASGTNPAVIGTKDSAGYLNFNYSDIKFENITIETYTNHGAAAPVLTGLNMQYASKISATKLSIGLDTTLQASSSPSGSEVAGFIESHYSNDGPNIIQECYVWGYKYGYISSEHTYFINSYAIGDYYAFVFPFMNFTVSGKVLIHACPHGLYYPTADVMGVLHGAAWTNLEVELETDSSTTNGFNTVWYKTLDQITDASSYGHGVIRMMNLLDGGGAQLTINTPGTNIHAVSFDYLTGAGSPGGVNGNIQYDSAALFAGSPNLFWDYTNKRLGVGTNAPATIMDVEQSQSAVTQLRVGNASTGAAALAEVQLLNNNSKAYQIGVSGSGYTPAYGDLGASVGFAYTNTANGMLFMDDANAPMMFATGSGAPAAERMRITGGGDVLMGTTTDNGLVTVAGIVVPEANTTRDLGTSSFAWRDIYFSHTISESAIGVASSLGSNVSSVTNSGSDEDFQMVMVTSGNVAGTMAFIAFGRTWIARPHCTISAADAVTGGAIYGVATSYAAFNATSASSATFTASIIGAGTYTFNCHCGQ